MKNTFKLFVTLFLLVFALPKAEAQTEPNYPTFNMTVKNITTQPGPNDRDSLLFFDVYMQQTNFGQTGVDPFEFCCAQYAWLFNRNVTDAVLPPGPGQPNSSLVASAFIPSYTPLLPPTSQILQDYDVANQQSLLQFSGNLPNSAINYFISSVFPGTFMMRVRMRTPAHRWNIVPLNLRFKLGAAPNTFVAYFLPFADTVDTDVFPPPAQFAQALMDTVVNQYSVDDPGFVLPVELSSFTSNVNKNVVTLNWTTATETNNQGFDIERSVVNSNEWTKAGYLAGNGTTTEQRSYSFNDRADVGTYNYRLKQIDFNGAFNYHALTSEVTVGIPSVYAISQNYPNPFNPTTKIDFELPYDGKVSILLYDISGREVAKLVNEVMTAGYHNIQFNGSNLASGMYFYRINADGGTENFVATKKMVLIK